MSITSKKGDSGYTSLLRGQRVPKYHLATEAVGVLDEANSHLGLGRAASNDNRIKRIILQVQKHLFIIGAEISVLKGEGSPPRKKISEGDIGWLDRLVQEFEEAMALPPGFVAFGQEISSSHLDVARTSVRKTERIVVKMQSEEMIENPKILTYLNRLSDVIFLLACYEEKNEGEKKKISSSLVYGLSNPFFRKWIIFSGFIMATLIGAIILILIYHDPSTKDQDSLLRHHEEMQFMHEPPANNQ